MAAVAALSMVVVVGTLDIAAAAAAASLLVQEESPKALAFKTRTRVPAGNEKRHHLEEELLRCFLTHQDLEGLGFRA